MDKMDEIEEFISENSYKIWINNFGGVVVDSTFDKGFKAIGGDIWTLHSAIEDNVYQIDDDDESGEEIDWSGVMKTYIEIDKGMT